MSKFLVLIIAILFLEGCVKPRPLNENTVIVHITAQPNGLHPINDNSVNRSYIFEYTQRRLNRIDLRTLQNVSSLIVVLPKISENQLFYTYQLRNDVKWDDGTPFTVDDVIFTIKLELCKLSDNAQVRGNYTSVIKNIVKNSPYCFTMETWDVQVTNKDILQEAFMQEKKLFDPKGITDKISFEMLANPDWQPSNELIAWFNGFNSGDNRYDPSHLVGLGPYQVTKWQSGSYIVLEKKKKWWGAKDTSFYNKAYPDKIIFQVISDDAAYKMALKNQQIDVSTYISTEVLLKLQKLDYFNNNYYSAFKDQYSYGYMGLNTRPDGIENKPFFTDVKVRRAMAYLVPVDDIIKIVLHGKGSRQTANVSPLKSYYNKDLVPIPLDVTKAKQLLDEAGWKDTDGDNIRDKIIDGNKIQFSFKLNYMTGSLGTKQMVLMIKNQMYKAGINLEPNPMEFTTFYEAAQNHNFDAILGGWGGGADYSNPYQLWHTSQWANKGANFCGFGDAVSDSLIVAVNKAMDPNSFAEIDKALQKKIYDEQPYIFLYSYKRKIAIHKRFAHPEMFPERPGVALNYLLFKSEYSSSIMTPVE